MRNLTLAVVLPHTRIFGGVKRFFEIGNILLTKGHQFMVFTPEGTGPEWFDFKGPVLPLEQLHNHSFDAVFITEPDFLNDLKKVKSRLRIFYAVLQRRYIRKVVADKELIVLANSTSLYEYLGGSKRENLIKCVGGIDPEKFEFRVRRRSTPGVPLVVLVYGRFYRRKKGTMLVVKACENLFRKGYKLKLLLFDTPVDDEARRKVQQFTCSLPFQFVIDYPVEKVADLYHQADLFISAERNAGWSNTSAEAMACGVPVIATRSGTEDFLFHEETGLQVWRHPWFIQRAIRRLYQDENLRISMAERARKKIENFSWKNLANALERLIAEKLDANIRE